jgi:hypothetical protein
MQQFRLNKRRKEICEGREDVGGEVEIEALHPSEAGEGVLGFPGQPPSQKLRFFQSAQKNQKNSRYTILRLVIMIIYSIF